MVINRDYVKVRLQKIECKYRGYYGTDIAEIAKELNVTSFRLKKQISTWAKVDSSFAGFTCLGKHRPSITLEEFIEIKDRIQSNPLELKKHLLSDIRDKRELRNEDTLSTATFYRRANQVELSLFTNKFWSDEEKCNFMRDPPLVNAINPGNWDIAKLKAIDRIVEYIHGYETDTLKRLLFYGFRSHEHGFRDGRSAESLWGKC